MANILIIDDESLVRRVLRRTLEYAGHEVTEAPDGDAGIGIYRDQPKDLVITDIQMPKKDGFEVIRELRHDFPEVKIIATSGSSPDKANFVSTTRELGAKRFISKPFDVEQMLDTVKELLQ